MLKDGGDRGMLSGHGASQCFKECLPRFAICGVAPVFSGSMANLGLWNGYE